MTGAFLNQFLAFLRICEYTKTSIYFTNWMHMTNMNNNARKYLFPNVKICNIIFFRCIDSEEYSRFGVSEILLKSWKFHDKDPKEEAKCWNIRIFNHMLISTAKQNPFTLFFTSIYHNKGWLGLYLEDGCFEKWKRNYLWLYLLKYNLKIKFWLIQLFVLLRT